MSLTVLSENCKAGLSKKKKNNPSVAYILYKFLLSSIPFILHIVIVIVVCNVHLVF